jgi:hypothetical protein
VGAPVEVLEKQPTSCKKTLTATIQFKRASDYISTIGLPVTTTNVACPGTAR